MLHEIPPYNVDYWLLCSLEPRLRSRFCLAALEKKLRDKIQNGEPGFEAKHQVLTAVVVVA